MKKFFAILFTLLFVSANAHINRVELKTHTLSYASYSYDHYEFQTYGVFACRQNYLSAQIVPPFDLSYETIHGFGLVEMPYRHITIYPTSGNTVNFSYHYQGTVNAHAMLGGIVIFQFQSHFTESGNKIIQPTCS